MLKGLFTEYDKWLVSSYLSDSWRVPIVMQEMVLILNGVPKYTFVFFSDIGLSVVI